MNLGEITQRLEKLNEWSLEGNAISRVFNFNSFKEALEFINKVGEKSEEMNHHPEIIINYNIVKLSLMTHLSGGLTEKDFALAEEIDRI